MRRRISTGSRVTSALVWAAVLVMLGNSAPAVAQEAERWDPDYQPPRTAWGHPDLQGNWTNETITPLQREEGVTGPVFSWDEVARRQTEAVERFLSRLQPSDPDRPLLTPEEFGAYNGVYIDRGERVAVVDGEPRTSLITFPEDGQVPELTPEGRKRVEEYFGFRASFGTYDHPEVRPLGERCIVSFGSSLGPPMTPQLYNSNYTIVQNADHILIRSEMVHDTRIIRLGEPNRLPKDIRLWFGDSWGRWEGNTLVVETTNVHPDQAWGRGERVRILPSKDHKVIERFTRVDEDTVLYEFEVQDPTTYTEPWGGQIPMERSDERIFEYACHEGNYAMPNILSGARYQEAAAQTQADENRSR